MVRIAIYHCSEIQHGNHANQRLDIINCLTRVDQAGKHQQHRREKRILRCSIFFAYDVPVLALLCIACILIVCELDERERLGPPAENNVRKQAIMSKNTRFPTRQNHEKGMSERWSHTGYSSRWECRCPSQLH